MRRAFFSLMPVIILMNKKAYFATNKVGMSFTSVFVYHLKGYVDLFPEEVLKGLPPIGGIEHQIDFVPGAQIPNKPPYRCNPEETKEL